MDFHLPSPPFSFFSFFFSLNIEMYTMQFTLEGRDGVRLFAAPQLRLLLVNKISSPLLLLPSP